MSAQGTIPSINNILDPYLFQVIGSTPSGIKDSLKKSTLKGNMDSGIELASAAVFAAAVNKVVLEDFLLKPEMVHARPAIQASLSINGKTNMTGMTLLGHCLLATGFMDDVVFVKEFRHKMGQDNLWDGDFTKGSLSEKQKKIYEEKKRVTPVSAARLLGSGFFKYVGVDKTPWTLEESAFWDESNTGPEPEPMKQSRAQPSGPPPQVSQASPSTQPQQKTAQPASPPRQSQPNRLQAPVADQNTGYSRVTLLNGSTVYVSTRAVDFYMGDMGKTVEDLATSVQSRGAENFSQLYSTAAEQGLKAAAASGASTVGR